MLQMAYVTKVVNQDGVDYFAKTSVQLVTMERNVTLAVGTV